MTEIISAELKAQYRLHGYYPLIPGDMSDILRVGDRITRQVVLGGGTARQEITKLLTGRVIYIHPEERFFDAEFRIKEEAGGNEPETITQSFHSYVDEMSLYLEAKAHKNVRKLYGIYEMNPMEEAYITGLIDGRGCDVEDLIEASVKRETGQFLGREEYGESPEESICTHGKATAAGSDCEEMSYMEEFLDQ